MIVICCHNFPKWCGCHAGYTIHDSCSHLYSDKCNCHIIEKFVGATIDDDSCYDGGCHVWHIREVEEMLESFKISLDFLLKEEYITFDDIIVSDKQEELINEFKKYIDYDERLNIKD